MSDLESVGGRDAPIGELRTRNRPAVGDDTRPPRVAFVLGRAPSRSSVLLGVIARLQAAGVDASTDVVSPDRPWPATARQSDLVVLRALDGIDLDRARQSLGPDVPCCNPMSATVLARDKARTTRHLADAGISVPVTRLCHRWSEVTWMARHSPVVVKPAAGSRGEGIIFVPRADERPSPAFRGPWLVQQRIDGDGWDRKLYVTGTHVGGVLRRWPPRSLSDKRGRPLDVDPELADVARRSGAALGLEVFGVDVVVAQAGPFVVDVNAFPGFKGVPGAATWIAGHLLGHVRPAADEAAALT